MKVMPRFCVSMKNKQIRALACQADEDGTFPVEEIHMSPQHSPNKAATKSLDQGGKSRLKRSLNALKCLSPLAVLREVRTSRTCADEDDSFDLSSDFERSKYCGIFDEKATDGLFFKSGGLNRKHNLANELFNSEGELRVVKEGREWEDDADHLEEESVGALKAASLFSPSTHTAYTMSSECYSSDDEPTEPIFKIVDQSGGGYMGNDLFGSSERIGIQPIHLQMTPDFTHGAKRIGRLPLVKPDPPALKISDGDFSYEEGMSYGEPYCDIAVSKKCESDRTVVSELTCDDSFSEATSSQKEHAAAIQLVRETFQKQSQDHRQHESSEPRDEMQSTISQGSSKMQDLISKFESLTNSKATIERYSLVSKLQRTDDQDVSSSVVGTIARPSILPKSKSQDRGFFWRSYPQPQDTSDTCPDDSDVEVSTVSREFSESHDDSLLASNTLDPSDVAHI